MVLLWIALATAGDLARDWGTLYDARLVEIVDGTPEVAVELYRELLTDRPQTDPLYASTALWLGRALLNLGELAAAEAALGISATVPAHRDEAVRLIEETQLRNSAIVSLPQTWGFETGTFPAVRRAADGTRGALGVRRVGESVVLSWATSIRPGEPDYLALRLSDGLVVRELRARVRPVEFPAVIRVVALDGEGRRWVSDDHWLGNEDWSDIVVATQVLKPELGSAGLGRMRSVAELRIEDVSGERSPVRGDNTLLLDDVSVR